jgi:hypothetical protein
MRTFIAVAVLALSGCGAPAASTPCVLSWSGDVTGTGSCDGASSDALLGTGTATSLNWIVDAKNDTHTVSFQFQVPNPPSEGSYNGIDSATQYCSVTVTAKDTSQPVLSAFSRTAPGSGTPPRGSCSIVFTSKTQGSTATGTIKYTVHGTASATVVAINGAAQTATVTATF